MTAELATRRPGLPRAAAWRDCFAAAAAHLPENAAYGLLALAPLGPLFGPEAMMLALLAAVLANAVGSAIGGGWLVGGPRASLALLTAGFAAALVARLDATGLVASPWIVLLLLAVGLAGAGLMQMLFGVLRLGNVVKYTPHPVRLGLASGVGLLLMLTALPVLLGQGFGARLGLALHGPLTSSLLVGAVALAVAWVAQGKRWPVPSTLLGLVAGSALHAVLALDPSTVQLSKVLGAPGLELDWIARIAQEARDLRLFTDRTLSGLVASFALTAAVLCSLDTLLAVSVVDGRLRRGRDASRELVAQGAANVAVACVGGMPTSPSIARSLSLIGADTPRASGLRAYTLAMAMLTALAVPLLSRLPESAVGGVLMLQGARMVSPSLWRTPIELWNGRHGLRGLHWRTLAANWAVAATVAGNAVVLGLGPAVFIGASCAVLLFVRANMREVVRHEATAATRRSLKMRSISSVDTLRVEGGRIVVLELEGSLFFGTADVLRERLQAMPPQVSTVILDLHQVAEVDVTAARILIEAAEDWQRLGRRLVFAELPAGDARRTLLEAVAGPSQRSLLKLADTTDTALEEAEDLLLAELRIEQRDGPALSLEHTLLGRGLEPEELGWLAAQLQTVRFACGERLFRVGDPGDALYVSVSGDIGLRIPGTERRLASFAPGVTIGEMAVLLHGTRSAEAVAETDVVALRLSAAAFDQFMLERPVMAAKLLRNLTLSLSDRVRVLTGDLAQWVARSAVGRSASGAVTSAPMSGDAEAKD